MIDLPSILLIVSILAGQIIKIPVGTHGGATLLDVTVIFLTFVGLAKLKFKLKKPPLFITASLFFILIAVLSLILTPLNLVITQYITSFSYIIRFSSFILLSWIIYSEAFPDLKKNILRILTWSGIGLAILGFLQFIFLPDLRFLESFGWDPHFFRTVSTFLDPNFTGAFFVLTLILFMSSPRRRGSNSERDSLNWIPVFAGMTLTYLALLTTFSRSSYLMFLVSGLTFAILRKSRKIFISTIILFIILLVGFQIYSQAVAQPRGIDREQSAHYRVDSWQRGWQIFTQSPVLGVGYNTYRYALKEYNLAPESYLATHGASGNDSSLLHVMATTGVVGLTGYLFFLSSFKPLGVIIWSALLGLIAHSFFANSLFYPFLLIWLILMATKKDLKS